MKLFLAPIHGVTLDHYRNQFAEIFEGFDAYYAPFIATAEEKKVGKTIFRDILPKSDTTMNVVPQLLGNNGTDFRNYASIIADMGYKEINWNIGCPSGTVIKKKKGSGILPHPDMIKAFLDEVCKDDSYDLTVKMRLGLDKLEEGIDVIDLLNQYPLSGVTIHGRTGKQQYEGHVDLDSFEVLYSACKHEMTYNGDIYTVEDFKRIQARFPLINKFMLGRGALKNPFLPSIIKGINISDSEKLKKMKDFHDSLYNYYKSQLSIDKHSISQLAKDKLLLSKMKEFWVFKSTHVDPSGKHFEELKKSTTCDVYLDIVDQMLETSGSWQETI